MESLLLSSLERQTEVLGVGICEVDGVNDIPHLTEGGCSALRPFEGGLRAANSASPVAVVIERRVRLLGCGVQVQPCQRVRVQCLSRCLSIRRLLFQMQYSSGWEARRHNVDFVCSQERMR